MTSPETSSVQQQYYDPAEVEAYVKDVTATIKTLQSRLLEATRRAEHAEEGSGDQQHETASLGRALLLAGEVADKTIADADSRAAEIVRSAEERASGIVQSAHDESRLIVESARGTASVLFQAGESRLLDAVAAFVEGSNVLRAELAKISDDATSWGGSINPSAPPQPPTFIPSPPVISTPPASTGNGRRAVQAGRPPPGASEESPFRVPTAAAPPQPSDADQASERAWSGALGQPGGIHNRASRNEPHGISRRPADEFMPFVPPAPPDLPDPPLDERA